jgi:hypothetical protein
VRLLFSLFKKRTSNSLDIFIHLAHVNVSKQAVDVRPAASPFNGKGLLETGIT